MLLLVVARAKSTTFFGGVGVIEVVGMIEGVGGSGAAGFHKEVNEPEGDSCGYPPPGGEDEKEKEGA